MNVIMHCPRSALTMKNRCSICGYQTQRAFYLPLRRGRFSQQMVWTFGLEKLKGHCAKSRHQLLCLVNANFAMPVNRIFAKPVSHFGTEDALAHNALNQAVDFAERFL
jgi:hypothetical protein